MEDFVGNKFDTFYFNQGFFKPRAREGCDVIQTGLPPAYKISIHAPAMGATLEGLRIPEKMPISIHAPAMGATSCLVRDACVHLISIHAPARGCDKNP